MDSNAYSQAVAENVRRTISDSALSVAEVAAKSGLPRTTLERRLTGSSSLTVREVKALADVLGTTAADLTTVTEARVAA